MTDRPGFRRGDEPPSEAGARVRALRAAYRCGRLVVAADAVTLARVRGEEGHAIDARDVAEAMLRRAARTEAGFRPPGRG